MIVTAHAHTHTDTPTPLAVIHKIHQEAKYLVILVATKAYMQQCNTAAIHYIQF